MKASIKTSSRGSKLEKRAENEGKKPKVMKIKGGMKYRGAREQWYNMLQRFEGKTVEEFVEAAIKEPPSRTKKNEAEPPTGWVRFFQRSGVISLS